MKRFMLLTSALVITAGVATAFAEDKANDNKKNFQEYVDRFGSPGPEHKLLEPLVGDWQCKTKFWVDPADAPQTAEGTVKRKMVLGGRFVCEEADSKMMGKPYQGFGTMGYDRGKKQFVSSWIDSMDTAMHTAHGTYDEGSKTWTFKHEDTCPITGKPVRVRDTLKIVGPNEQQMEMFRQLGEEKEAKVMEISFTRMK